MEFLGLVMDEYYLSWNFLIIYINYGVRFARGWCIQTILPTNILNMMYFDLTRRKVNLFDIFLKNQAHKIISIILDR